MSFSQELIDKYAPEAECIQAMKIWKLPDGKENMFPEMCINGNYFAELKKDGYWYEFEKTNNHMYLFSRNVSKNTGILTEKLANVPHIKEALQVVPKGTILYMGYPVESTNNKADWTYEIKTTASCLGGDFTTTENMLNTILNIMKNKVNS